MPQLPRLDIIPTNNKTTSFHQYSDANDISRSLQNLSRSYTGEIKYADMDDSLDHQISISYELYSRNRITQDYHIKAFSTILKGIAADFYYSNLSRLPPSFECLYQIVKTNFKGEEYHQRTLNKWNSLTLQNLIQQNPQHDTITCMEMLAQSLRTLQHSLDPEFRADKFIQFKMIAACKNVSACKHACLTPPPTFSRLLNFLQSSFTMYDNICQNSS